MRLRRRHRNEGWKGERANGGREYKGGDDKLCDKQWSDSNEKEDMKQKGCTEERDIKGITRPNSLGGQWKLWKTAMQEEKCLADNYDTS